MSDKFQDVVIIYKDLTTGKEHTQKDHFKLEDRDKMLSRLVNFENPKLKDRVLLSRVKFYGFFGTKVKESFSRVEFGEIKGYSDKLHEMKKAWKRDEDIDLILNQSYNV